MVEAEIVEEIVEAEIHFTVRLKQIKAVYLDSPYLN